MKFAERFLGAVDRLPSAATAAPCRASPADRPRAPAVRLVVGVGRDAAAGLWSPVFAGRSTAARVDRCAAPGRGPRQAAHAIWRGNSTSSVPRTTHLRKEARIELRAGEPIALVLRPQTRAVGPVSVIALSPGVGVVAFDLELEGSDFSQYQVALKDPVTTHIVWRSGVLTPRSSRRPPGDLRDRSRQRAETAALFIRALRSYATARLRHRRELRLPDTSRGSRPAIPHSPALKVMRKTPFVRRSRSCVPCPPRAWLASDRSVRGRDRARFRCADPAPSSRARSIATSSRLQRPSSRASSSSKKGIDVVVQVRDVDDQRDR